MAEFVRDALQSEDQVKSQGTVLQRKTEPSGSLVSQSSPFVKLQTKKRFPYQSTKWVVFKKGLLRLSFALHTHICARTHTHTQLK